MTRFFTSAWHYRGFVVSTVANEIRGRLARSTFGFAWVVLHPLAQIAIFSTVLSSVLAARLEGIDNKYAYAAYLMSGILCWTLFADILQRLLTVFIDNAALLRKMSFPRSVLPLVAVGGALVNHVALGVVLLLALPLLGFAPNWYWLWLIPLGAVTVLFALGLGLVLGVLNVFIRDIGQGVGVVLQLWFWLTPVIYPASIVPERLMGVMGLNPMYHLVTAYHQVLVFGTAPAFPWAMLVLATALVLAGWGLFRRASAELVDAL